MFEGPLGKRAFPPIVENGGKAGNRSFSHNAFYFSNTVSTVLAPLLSANALTLTRLTVCPV